MTADQDYCKPFQHTDFMINSVECPCAIAKEYRPKMDETSVGRSPYNECAFLV